VTPHPTPRLCSDPTCRGPTTVTERHTFPTGRIELTVECLVCHATEIDVQWEKKNAIERPVGVRGL
jgi:hypothetical protein